MSQNSRSLRRQDIIAHKTAEQVIADHTNTTDLSPSAEEVDRMLKFGVQVADTIYPIEVDMTDWDLAIAQAAQKVSGKLYRAKE